MDGGREGESAIPGDDIIVVRETGGGSTATDENTPTVNSNDDPAAGDPAGDPAGGSATGDPNAGDTPAADDGGDPAAGDPAGAPAGGSATGDPNAGDTPAADDGGDPAGGDPAGAPANGSATADPNAGDTPAADDGGDPAGGDPAGGDPSGGGSSGGSDPGAGDTSPSGGTTDGTGGPNEGGGSAGESTTPTTSHGGVNGESSTGPIDCESSCAVLPELTDCLPRCRDGTLSAEELYGHMSKEQQYAAAKLAGANRLASELQSLLLTVETVSKQSVKSQWNHLSHQKADPNQRIEVVAKVVSNKLRASTKVTFKGRLINALKAIDDAWVSVRDFATNLGVVKQTSLDEASSPDAGADADADAEAATRRMRRAADDDMEALAFLQKSVAASIQAFDSELRAVGNAVGPSAEGVMREFITEVQVASLAIAEEAAIAKKAPTFVEYASLVNEYVGASHANAKIAYDDLQVQLRAVNAAMKALGVQSSDEDESGVDTAAVAVGAVGAGVVLVALVVGFALSRNRPEKL